MYLENEKVLVGEHYEVYLNREICSSSQDSPNFPNPSGKICHGVDTETGKRVAVKLIDSEKGDLEKDRAKSRLIYESKVYEEMQGGGKFYILISKREFLENIGVAIMGDIIF